MPIAAWPLIEVAIEPNSEADRERLDVAIAKLSGDDSNFSASIDQETGQIILKGMSELHLDVIVDALKRAHKVEANVGAPQVAYREKLGRAATIDYTHKRQTGSSGQFARVKIEFVPGKPGAGFVFKSAIAEGAVATEYVPAVEKGLNVSKENGLLAGFPVIDFTATLIDGAYHDLDSSARTFQIASQAAFRELKDKADPRLLEPIMKLEVANPEESVDVVIRDLRSRRAIIQSQDKRGDATIIHALTPLSNLFGYVNTLRRLSHGGAAYVIEFSHYEEAPLAPRDPELPPAAAAALRA